jgi:galactokinase
LSKTFVEKAHGRVNLIGEHTDYNGGWVLPTAIPQYTQVTLEKRKDQKVIITSSHEREFMFELGQEKPTNTWVDYLQGATKILKEYVSKNHQSFSGFSAKIESSMPEGSGLSSSAALEISFLKAIRSAYDLTVSDPDLARIGQRIENEFVGARVGIMDQMACSLAKSGEALFLDTLNLTYERVVLPLDQMDILVINSGITHRLSASDGGYNQRRAQCEEACQILGIHQLRDISPEKLKTKILPEVLARRARHVVTENARVHAAVNAIHNKDLKRLGELFIQSHISMRDDYEVSIPEIDILVNLCLKYSEVYGARLTGGGFGGSIVAITKKGHAKALADLILPEYFQLTKEKATVLS